MHATQWISNTCLLCHQHVGGSQLVRPPRRSCRSALLSPLLLSAAAPASPCRSVRQKFFTRTAGLLLVLMTCYAACATAALASTVAQLGCAFPWTALAATDFLQVGQRWQGAGSHCWEPQRTCSAHLFCCSAVDRKHGRTRAVGCRWGPEQAAAPLAPLLCVPAGCWLAPSAWSTHRQVLAALSLPFHVLYICQTTENLSKQSTPTQNNTGACPLQWTFFSAILLVLLARMQAMTLWRGKGALDMQASLLGRGAAKSRSDATHSRGWPLHSQPLAGCVTLHRSCCALCKLHNTPVVLLCALRALVAERLSPAHGPSVGGPAALACPLHPAMVAAGGAGRAGPCQQGERVLWLVVERTSVLRFVSRGTRRRLASCWPVAGQGWCGGDGRAASGAAC